MNEIDEADLENRLMRYHTLDLPGQPKSAHAETSYLINDLNFERIRLKRELAALKEKLGEGLFG